MSVIKKSFSWDFLTFNFSVILEIFFLLSFRKCSRRDETRILLNRQHFGDHIDEYLLVTSSLRQSARRQMLEQL